MSRVPATSNDLRNAAAAATLSAIVALAAYGRWPYDYYEIFRWAIAGGAVLAGFFMRGRPAVLIGYLAVAFEFNPIVPMRMRAYAWRHFDLAAAAIMGAVAAYAIYLRAAVRPRSPTE